MLQVSKLSLFRGDADLRRRRSVPEPPYGYANRPQMMNNYGGTMPQQTPYGYSGWNDGSDGCISSYFLKDIFSSWSWEHGTHAHQHRCAHVCSDFAF